MAISYFIDCEGFKFTSRRLITAWLKQVAQSHNTRIGDVNVIFTSSEKLLEINRQFLQHDYFTDIITFDDSNLETGEINGELYIDIETVADNAQQLGIENITELHRILAHGILHLTGQGDKSPEEAAEMRKKEEAALAALEFLKGSTRGA